MTELDRIFLTSGLTVVGGSLVFVIQRFMLEPLNEQSKVLGKVTFALFYHGREYANPIKGAADEETEKRYRQAADKMRELAGLMAETSQSVRLYWIFVALRLTPPRKSVHAAIGLLTRLSNSFFAPDDGTMNYGVQNSNDADQILRMLGLKKWGK